MGQTQLMGKKKANMEKMKILERKHKKHQNKNQFITKKKKKTTVGV